MNPNRFVFGSPRSGTTLLLGSQVVRERRWIHAGRLCGCVGLVFDPRMLRFYEGRPIARPGPSAKKPWRPVTPGVRRWREQMTPDDVRRFEATAGSLLEELGYERAIKSPSNAELGRAARLREEFVADLRSRGRQVPVTWSQHT